MDSDLSRPDLAEQGRCLERRDGLAKELHWVRRLVCLGHGIFKLLDFEAFPERKDQLAEVAGFGFQLGTKGCLAAKPAIGRTQGSARLDRRDIRIFMGAPEAP